MRNEDQWDELDRSVNAAVLKIRQRYNEACRRLNLPTTSFVGRSPFEQEEGAPHEAGVSRRR